MHVVRFRTLFLAALLSRVGDVRDAAAQSSTGATVSGVVRDSIGRSPLVGAWVQMVGTDSGTHFARTVASDSLGRFAMVGVPDGRYTLGFFHPMLDSLGVEPPPRAVTVIGQRPVRADLAIPGPARLRGAICGARGAQDPGGVVVGVVRGAQDGAPSAGVKVTGEWLEFTFRPGGIDRRRPRLIFTTGANGWFALCNVPSGGTMFVMAGRGPDSTDLVEVQVPADGFVRRDLFLGAARSVVAVDTSRRADTLASSTRRMRLGDGRLRGTVVTSDGSRPLAGAVVRITDGPFARANEFGEWMLVDAPAGTRMLEVRAVGYYPVHRVVDVVPDAAPVRVALSTFKAMLDTVRITADRIADRHGSGFEERRQTGMGHFLTAQDIVKRGAIDVSDVFKNLPGVRMEYDTTGSIGITMRSSFGEFCAPTFYVDGLRMFSLSADELNGMVNVKSVRAIEVYTDATVPMQFQQAMSGCGAIVIWTK